ncbi:MAG: UDP-N-acetylmuramoyl-tripeptide--D-alanyl-D-alanine ligase [Kiritimatiellae bacterium]|nr:UDP-N-acetylmuramoyl-tripeptide--D-alanyl-D-alanine ligase [Kiritimatiellia bacterium]
MNENESSVFADALDAFTGATFDSRQVKPGMLYVALKGERVDGHDFVAAAFAAGATRALVRTDWAAPAGVEEARLIRVPDTRLGFGALARAYRETLDAVVVGITGSAGKTTVKELTAAFLRAGGHRVHATSGNFNNDLGLPLTVLNCPRDAEFLVLEMGTNHPGEIKYLVDIAHPQVGLVSSIGTAHIEFFKTQDGIAAEKGTLLANLSPVVATQPSFAVLARENDRYAALCAMSAASVESVSLADTDAAAFADALAVRLPGRHNVLNALIAYGCARRFGISLEACLGALTNFALPGGRWRVVERGGVTYIDDTYNANPTSMVTALETFAGLPRTEGRRIAVLGDMFELGDKALAYHIEALIKARELGLEKIVLVGDTFRQAAGSRPDLALGCLLAHDAEEARTRLAAVAAPGDRVLVKASHGMCLGRVVES